MLTDKDKVDILSAIELMKGLSPEASMLYLKLCVPGMTSNKAMSIWETTMLSDPEKTNLAAILTLIKKLKGRPDAWRIFQLMGKCPGEIEARQLLARS